MVYLNVPEFLFVIKTGNFRFALCPIPKNYIPSIRVPVVLDELSNILRVVLF